MRLDWRMFGARIISKNRMWNFRFKWKHIVDLYYNYEGFSIVHISSMFTNMSSSPGGAFGLTCHCPWATISNKWMIAGVSIVGYLWHVQSTNTWSKRLWRACHCRQRAQLWVRGHSPETRSARIMATDWSSPTCLDMSSDRVVMAIVSVSCHGSLQMGERKVCWQNDGLRGHDKT